MGPSGMSRRNVASAVKSFKPFWPFLKQKVYSCGKFHLSLEKFVNLECCLCWRCKKACSMGSFASLEKGVDYDAPNFETGFAQNNF